MNSGTRWRRIVLRALETLDPAPSQLRYNFPLYGKMKGYVQYFYGYGARRVDNAPCTHYVSVGIVISDGF
jgi:phospholipase A1